MRKRHSQLIYQLVGRALHSDKNPIVIIQSYSTDNFYIQHACKQEIEKSYISMMKERKELLKKCYKIYFVSTWVEEKFFKGMDKNFYTNYQY